MVKESVAAYRALSTERLEQSLLDWQRFFNGTRSATTDDILELGASQWRREVWAADVQARTKRRDTALEIGHGNGRLLRCAALEFGRVVGVDVLDEHEAVRATIGDVPNVSLCVGDGASLPADDATADFVYCMNVFLHVPSLDVMRGYIKEARRVLRPGGVFRFNYAASEQLIERRAPANHSTLRVPTETVCQMLLGWAGCELCLTGEFLRWATAWIE